MVKMDTCTLIEKLKDIFAKFGLLNVVILDNGVQFKTSEFVDFCKINGIKYFTSPHFYPATNGVAKNAVKSFKAGIYKALNDTKKK